MVLTCCYHTVLSLSSDILVPNSGVIARKGSGEGRWLGFTKITSLRSARSRSRLSEISLSWKACGQSRATLQIGPCNVAWRRERSQRVPFTSRLMKGNETRNVAFEQSNAWGKINGCTERKRFRKLFVWPLYQKRSAFPRPRP